MKLLEKKSLTILLGFRSFELEVRDAVRSVVGTLCIDSRERALVRRGLFVARIEARALSNTDAEHVHLNIALNGRVGAVLVRRIDRPTHPSFADRRLAVGGVHNVGTAREHVLIGNFHIASQSSALAIGNNRHSDLTRITLINRHGVIIIDAVEPQRTGDRRIRQSSNTGRVELNVLGEPNLVIALSAEGAVRSHGKHLRVELTGSQRNLKGLLARQNGDGEQRPTCVNLSVLDLRSRRCLSDLVKIEHMSIAALKPNTRNVCDVALVSGNILRHIATSPCKIFIETLKSVHKSANIKV